MIKKFSQFYQEDSGVIMIEFALMLPIFILIFLSATSIADYVYAQQKMKNAASNVLNIINTQENVSCTQLDRIIDIVPEVTNPIPITNTDFRVVVTAIQRDFGEEEVYIHWQHAKGPATFGDTRFVYTEGGEKSENAVNPALLNNYNLFEGEQLISVEVFMRYNPVIDTDMTRRILNLSDNNGMEYHGTARPRKGAFQFTPKELCEGAI